MDVTRPLLVLELNELCPPLLERFMAAGDLPSLARLHAESTVCVTDPQEPQELLNPWIQWVTVHTGLGYEEHGVYKLGEGDRLRHPTIADVVGRAGGTVWLCGPMNVVPVDPVRGRWLPDPWHPDDRNIPADMRPFAEFVRANVQEHTNESHRLSPGMYARFVAFMLAHGMSPSTAWAVAGQLLGERARRRQRWERTGLLDRLQWDVFRHVYERERPTFATYFSNTTAHFQHTYWRYMDPSAFPMEPDAADVARFGDAVRAGYVVADRVVGEALSLVGDDATLVLCTALSQQPYVLKDDEGGSRFHRPREMAAIAEALGLMGARRVAPVMSAQFHVYFGSEADAATAEAALRGARIGDRAAFDVRRVGSDVFTGCALTDEVPADAVLEVPATGRSLGFHEHFYRAETPKSGYHHPDGALWVRVPGRAGRVVGERVPLRGVAPTLLALLGLPPADSMRTPPFDVVQPLPVS